MREHCRHEPRAPIDQGVTPDPADRCGFFRRPQRAPGVGILGRAAPGERIEVQGVVAEFPGRRDKEVVRAMDFGRVALSSLDYRPKARQARVDVSA